MRYNWAEQGTVKRFSSTIRLDYMQFYVLKSSLVLFEATPLAPLGVKGRDG